MTLTPRPYQIEGRDFLAPRAHALLADEMRVGKTPQAILAAHKAGAQSILVVCPAIAVPHWQREFPKWWPSGPLPRTEIWSYDRARINWQRGTRGTVDLFIPDECHFAKNPEAARTKMVYGKDGFAWLAGATWPLSGTPATKHAGELWPMLRAFGIVKCDYNTFVRHYCTINSFTLQITGTRQDKIPEVRAMLAQVMLRRTRREVAPDMPGIDFQFLPVEPTDKADLPSVAGLSDEELLAYCEATPTDREDRQAVAMAKVEPLVEHVAFALENNLLQQTVVFGWHTAPLMALTGALNDRGIHAQAITGKHSPVQRDRTQRMFREGSCKVVVANIIAAGTAIDLSAARHAYFLELDWLSSNNTQAASRLVSMEKVDKVTADVVTWPGSADDRVQQVLMRRVRELSQLI